MVLFLASLLFCSAQVLQADPTDAKDCLLRAKQRYNEIHSYRCKASNVVMKYGLVKATRYINTVAYSFQKPDKIRMTWLEPFLLKGQVAVFQNNELKVKLRFMPFAVRMDPDGLLTQDPAGNRIYDTHIGRLIDKLLEAITPATQVSIPGGSIGATNDEVQPVVIENKEGRVLVIIDRHLSLPTSMEFYGPDGRLSQACYFKDIALDVEFEPGEFDLSVATEAKAAN